jgi:hypothetical protein
MLFRQPLKSGIDCRAYVAGERQILGRCRFPQAPWKTCCMTVVREVVSVVEQIAAARLQEIPGAIAGNAVEPGVKRALAAKMLKSSIRFDERFLRRIFRIPHLPHRQDCAYSASPAQLSVAGTCARDARRQAIARTEHAARGSGRWGKDSSSHMLARRIHALQPVFLDGTYRLRRWMPSNDMGYAAGDSDTSMASTRSV